MLLEQGLQLRFVGLLGEAGELRFKTLFRGDGVFDVDRQQIFGCLSFGQLCLERIGGALAQDPPYLLVVVPLFRLQRASERHHVGIAGRGGCRGQRLVHSHLGRGGGEGDHQVLRILFGRAVPGLSAQRSESKHLCEDGLAFRWCSAAALQ